MTAQRGDFKRAGGLREQELRDVLRRHHPVMRSETGPFSGCRCGDVALGQDVIAHVLGHLLPLVSRHADQRAAEAKADLERRLVALADDFDELFRSERPGRTPCDHGIAYRRASLRLRDVLAGYEGSLFYGALPWLRARLTPPTENEEQHA